MGVISGPVIGGNYGWPFAKSMLDVTSYGYEAVSYTHLTLPTIYSV